MTHHHVAKKSTSSTLSLFIMATSSSSALSLSIRLAWALVEPNLGFPLEANVTPRRLKHALGDEMLLVHLEEAARLIMLLIVCGEIWTDMNL